MKNKASELIVGNLLDKFQKLYMKFVAVLEQWKILGNISFSEQIFYRKQLLGAPD